MGVERPRGRREQTGAFSKSQGSSPGPPEPDLSSHRAAIRLQVLSGHATSLCTAELLNHGQSHQQAKTVGRFVATGRDSDTVEADGCLLQSEIHSSDKRASSYQ